MISHNWCRQISILDAKEAAAMAVWEAMGVLARACGYGKHNCDDNADGDGNDGGNDDNEHGYVRNIPDVDEVVVVGVVVKADAEVTPGDGVELAGVAVVEPIWKM